MCTMYLPYPCRTLTTPENRDHNVKYLHLHLNLQATSHKPQVLRGPVQHFTEPGHSPASSGGVTLLEVPRLLHVLHRDSVTGTGLQNRGAALEASAARAARAAP